MLVRIPSISAHLGPLMPDKEIAEDALSGLGDFGQANIEDQKKALVGFMVAQAISIGTVIASEIIARNTKSEAVWRLLHAAIAGTTGYSAYKSFQLSSVAGKVDRADGVVIGGVFMTIDGLMSFGNALAVFGPVDTSAAGKKYKLVTATQTLKKITPAAVPV